MFLGIEIGGTKLQLGLGQGDGKIIARWRGTVTPEAGAEGIRQQIQQAIPDLLSQASFERSQIRGVGIGFGGPVDDATRTVIKSHQIQGWDNFSLAKWAEDLMGCPAALGNDADVAGLAEALFGAGKGLSPIFYITIGSGIGGGLIINGEIYRGCGRGAAEIGHLGMIMPGHGKEHDATLGGILEHYSSGWAIAARARAATVGGLACGSLLSRLSEEAIDKMTAADVAHAAAQGDGFAISLLNEAWGFLAYAISQVIALSCPRRIVIGGGVSLMGEKLLFEPLRTFVAALVFKPFADCYDIVPAQLGEEVVVQGALALAARKLGKASVEP